jgi:hypothetical protein
VTGLAIVFIERLVMRQVAGLVHNADDVKSVIRAQAENNEMPCPFRSTFPLRDILRAELDAIKIDLVAHVRNRMGASTRGIKSQILEGLVDQCGVPHSSFLPKMAFRPRNHLADIKPRPIGQVDLLHGQASAAPS